MNYLFFPDEGEFKPKKEVGPQLELFPVFQSQQSQRMWKQTIWTREARERRRSPANPAEMNQTGIMPIFPTSGKASAEVGQFPLQPQKQNQNKLHLVQAESFSSQATAEHTAGSAFSA
jgi:hypothetical protein